MTGTIFETRQEILKVEWKIKGFLLLKTSAKSPKFRFSNTWWCFEVYPNGEGEGEDFVALYLCSDELNTLSTIVFTLAIQKTDGTLISHDASVWKYQGKHGYGFREIISRSDLQQKKDEFMVEGTITFTCILNDACPTEAMDTLSLDLKKLLLSSAHSDLTVKLKSRSYKAHRVVLAARSDVFASALEHEMIEKESGVITIEDCDPDSFKEFLQHLYTSRANITEGNVFHLYRTADKYLVNELKWHCAAFMMENLSVDNVCEVIALADQHDDFDLRYICQDFFSKKAGSIFKTSKWKSLMKTNCELASEMLDDFASDLSDED